jgi:hypothetical protein
MPDFSVDGNRNVSDSRGQHIGKVDYSGNVWNGGRNRGGVVNNHYIDEYGRDHGWLSKSNSSSGSDGGFAGALGLFVLGIGVLYLIFLGVK